MLANDKGREFTECATCEGRGGTVEHDMQGDGIWFSPVSWYMPCSDCIEVGLCAGCGAEGVPLDSDIDTFTCEKCGWHIDWDRIDGPDEPDY